MSTTITICRGIGKPASADCADSQEPGDATTLAPCKVEADACFTTTGDARVEAGKSGEGQSVTDADCDCDC